MQFRKFAAAGLLALGALGTGVALAADDGKEERVVERHVIKHRGGPGHMASVEHAAMRNIMVEQLSARTGKTTTEIQALFEQGGPMEAFETLGVSDEDARAMHQQARQTLIERAQRAGLITAAQAEKLKQAKIDIRHKRIRRDRDDDHDDHD